MSRVRLAVALAVLAGVALVATAVVAVTTYVGDDPAPAAEPLVVRDRATGASFEVPGEGWELRGPRSRMFYADRAGRPVATVTGPAVYRDGYCAAEPGDSNRGFAGFTDQGWDTWVEMIAGGTDHGSAGGTRSRVRLTDGSTALVRQVTLPGGTGPCAAPGIALTMVSAGDVRAVVVADAGEPGTLARGDVRRILLSLELP